MTATEMVGGLVYMEGKDMFRNISNKCLGISCTVRLLWFVYDRVSASRS